MIAAFPLPPSLPQAMSACIVGIRRNEHSPLSQLKSLAYLDNILALREAEAAGCDEAILLNTAGRIAGGSRSNLFLVLDGDRHHAAAERRGAARHRAADRADAGDEAWDPGSRKQPWRRRIWPAPARPSSPTACWRFCP